MRILHLSWEYPPVVYGGLGRHVHALAETQAAQGHDVVVLTQSPGGEGRETDAEVNGVRILRVRPTAPGDVDWREDFQLWAFGFNTAVARTGIALGRSWRPQVIHAHDWLIGQAAVLLREVWQVPVVLTVHATEAGRTGGVIETPLSVAIHDSEAWTVAEADRVIVCSDAMQDEVVSLFGVEATEVSVIPNGIDPDRWRVPHESARDEAWLAGGSAVVFIGRLEEEKGVRTLLDAMPDVHRALPSARLLIVGEGGAGEGFRSHARQIGLSEDVVRFAGHVSEGDLRRLGAAAGVAVVPSWYEPFGFVALEAAVLGAPLVVSGVGGLATIVEDGRTGLVVPPGDAEALGSAIVATLIDPDAAHRRAEEARTAVIERYSWPSIAARVVDVCRAAAEGSPPSV